MSGRQSGFESFRVTYVRGEPKAALRLTVAVFGLLASGCSIYGPKLVDCKVHCADDLSCPAGTECSNGFCRPTDSDGFCACAPGEERACGGGQGECLAGVQRCGESKTWGNCIGEIKPSPELCDNKDNNCNGIVDDDPVDTPPCGRTKGVCAGHNQACVNGAYAGVCTDQDYGVDFQAIETRCDGKDNDCDGVVDGKPPTRLLNASRAYDLVAFDGGYALAWVQGLSPAPWQEIMGRVYDLGLQPIGTAFRLGVADGGVVLRSTGSGNRAWFLWENAANYDVAGVYVDRSNPGVPVPLPGLPRADAIGSTKVGSTAGALTAAYPIDGGIGLVIWQADGGAVSSRRLVPPDPAGKRFISVDSLVLSTASSTVAFGGTQLDDPATGSTSTYDGILSLDGTRYAEKYVWYGAVLLDSPKGLQKVYDGYCNYGFFGFTCIKSYLTVDYDVWDTAATPVDVRNSSDYAAIHGSHATVTNGDWVMSWVETATLLVGSPVPAARTIRFRTVDIDGGVAISTRIANAGSDFSAIVYSSNASTGTLDAVLTCAP